MARYKTDYAGERKTKYIGIYVTPEDYGKALRAATDKRLSLSAYARLRILSQHDHKTPQKKDAAEIIKLLTTIGNNLIQIAAGGVAASSLRGVLDDLKQAIAKVLKW